MKILLLVFLTLCASCSQSSKENEDVYHIPVRLKPSNLTSASNLPQPPPIQTYYLPSNFIIDTAGQIYFYQQQAYRWMCGTGIDWDTPPPFIDLRPEDIVKVPLESIESFVKFNVLLLDTADRRVAIALTKDTLTSPGISRILKLLGEKGSKANWAIRKVTQEEGTVLYYKEHNIPYDSEDIKWDSTKIGFPPKFDDMIKFVPPKLKDE